MKGRTKKSKPAAESTMAWPKFKSRDERPEVRRLFKNIKKALPQLKSLLSEVNDDWTYEDGIYRFYHQSFKVFGLQAATLRMVEALKSLAPPKRRVVLGKRLRLLWKEKLSSVLNLWFLDIVKEGTGRVFKSSDNEDWLRVTRPIVEAFFHARYFLEMVVLYGRSLKHPPTMLPSGWASVLYLYNLR